MRLKISLLSCLLLLSTTSCQRAPSDEVKEGYYQRYYRPDKTATPLESTTHTPTTDKSAT